MAKWTYVGQCGSRTKEKSKVRIVEVQDLFT